jgi:hypothetical protein
MSSRDGTSSASSLSSSSSISKRWGGFDFADRAQGDFCPEGPARNASRSDAGGDYRTQPGVLTPGIRKKRIRPEGSADCCDRRLVYSRRQSRGTGSTAPYRWSEVIHRSGTKAGNEALERERAQIVNNFAPRRVSYHE